MIIPKHLEIETINGYCTANCDMCSKLQWNRAPNIMNNDEFEKIIKRFEKYINEIEYLTLVGCGETLLDKEIYEKVRICKKNNFKNVAIVTNCTELNEEMSKNLIEAGLDTIICSIDGIDANTHEKIRKGTNYLAIVENVENFIKIRNRVKSKTKIIIRFVRQEFNYNQWTAFFNMWEKKVEKDCGDSIIKIDIHNWAGNSNLKKSDYNTNSSNKIICKDIFERQVIYSNGEVGLCCVDCNNVIRLGNVLKEDPISIFNNKVFSEYRKSMNEGKIFELKMCKQCDLPHIKASNKK